VKRFLILICLLLAGNLLSAEERTLLFKRDMNFHYISLEKVVDDNNETWFFIATLEPEVIRDNYTACYLYLWGDSEQRAKFIVSGLTEAENYYNYLTDDLELEIKKKDISFSDSQLVHCYYFAIEVE
jgi:hypothetical protein